jgi:hypothetical protein
MHPIWVTSVCQFHNFSLRGRTNTAHLSYCCSQIPFATRLSRSESFLEFANKSNSNRLYLSSRSEKWWNWRTEVTQIVCTCAATQRKVLQLTNKSNSNRLDQFELLLFVNSKIFRCAAG